MTKKQAQIYERWYDSALTNLFQCYRAPSIYKMNAMEHVKERMSKVNGYALRIIGYNTCQFSIGFLYKQGNEIWFHYETAHNMEDWRVYEG